MEKFSAQFVGYVIFHVLDKNYQVIQHKAIKLLIIAIMVTNDERKKPSLVSFNPHQSWTLVPLCTPNTAIVRFKPLPTA